MRHARVLALVGALFLGSLGTAQARDYFGIRVGFPEIGLQLGSSSLISRNLGGRITLDYQYQRSGTLLGGDLLYSLEFGSRSALEFAVYFGVGLGLGFANNAFDYNVHGVIGLELRPIRDLGLFVEARPVGLTTGGYYFGASLGLNFAL